jgi:predicted transcriptional regulator
MKGKKSGKDNRKTGAKKAERAEKAFKKNAKKKTEIILEYFEANPNKEFTPSDVGGALGLKSKLVASILGRLVSQGTIEKTKRGRYKYHFAASYDTGTIIKDTMMILTKSLGADILKGFGLDGKYKKLDSFLSDLRQKFGFKLANNLVKQAILKNCSHKDAEALTNQLGL